MKNLIRTAFVLSLITIFYNIVEGLISIYFGAGDETLALLGFGVDSFVEVISGIGIAHMIFRMKYSKVQTRDEFEKTALRITGTVFYLLTVGLIVGSVLNIIYDVKPVTTLPGIKTKSWERIKFGCNNSRCELHKNMLLSFFHSFSFKRTV
jgi:predicted permease